MFFSWVLKHEYVCYVLTVFISNTTHERFLSITFCLEHLDQLRNGIEVWVRALILTESPVTTHPYGSTYLLRYGNWRLLIYRRQEGPMT